MVIQELGRGAGIWMWLQGREEGAGQSPEPSLCWRKPNKAGQVLCSLPLLPLTSLPKLCQLENVSLLVVSSFPFTPRQDLLRFLPGVFFFFLQHQFQSFWLCPTAATDSNPAFDQSISLLFCLGPLLGRIHRFSRALGTGFVSVFNQTRPLELWI